MRFLFRLIFAFFPLRQGRPPKNPTKIVIIKPGALGDVVMTTPLISALKKMYPQAHITYVVGKWASEVLVHNPHIDQVIVVDDTVFYRRDIVGLLRLARTLRRQRFDLGFVLDRHYLAGIFAWAAGVKFRLGFDRFGEGFPHHRSVSVRLARYDGEYYLDLARALGYAGALGPMEVFPTGEDDQRAAKRWVDEKLEKKKTIGMVVGGAQNPGQVAFFKRWPLDSYKELIGKVIAAYPQTDVALFGGPTDHKMNQEVANAFPGRVHVFSDTSVLESVALMKHCQLFICHDTGPMHLAAAAGVPVLSIFGPTDPARLAPVGLSHYTIIHDGEVGARTYSLYGTMPALPLPLPCMTSITPDEVFGVVTSRYSSVISLES